MGMAAEKDEPTPTQRMARNRLAQLPPRKPFNRSAKLAESAQREAQRVASILAKDQPPAPPKKGKKGGKAAAPASVGPTPEWLERYNHIKDSPTTSSGFKMGRVYRKEPWFESLCARDDALTDDNAVALRYYRNTFEAAQHGKIKCTLASMVYGANEGDGHPTEALLRARESLLRMEALLGGTLHTVRAVAIEDLTYEQVAMARYGYRYAEYFDAASGTLEYRPRPKSGRHPTKIKIEFIEGVRLLTAAVLGISSLPANANSAPETTSIAPIRITDELRAAIAKKRASGREIGPVTIAWSVLETLCRENDLPAPSEDCVEIEFDGVTMAVRQDWPWGWVIGEAE
jgi:hypothetical protein